jgi:hypothetical protein
MPSIERIAKRLFVTAITANKERISYLEHIRWRSPLWSETARSLAMRLFCTLSIVLAALSAFTLASHAEGSWCAHYGRSGGTNCGFHSFEQCQAAVSGTGGFCSRG